MHEQLEIEPIVEEQTGKAVEAANALQIVDEPSYNAAADALTKVKTVGKLIKDRKERLTKPANEALKAARDLFRPFETEQARAESIIKGKMVAYYNQKQAEARKKEQQIERRVEKGTMKVDTAIAKAEQIERVESGQGATYRKVREVNVTDPTKVATKYLLDARVIAALTTAVRADALALGGTGEVMPGVTVTETTQLAAR